VQDAWQVSMQANRCRFFRVSLCFVTSKSKPFPVRNKIRCVSHHELLSNKCIQRPLLYIIALLTTIFIIKRKAHYLTQPS
jgi:hypothetical protein